MIKSRLVTKDNNRLNALLQLKISDSPYETIFESIARMAIDVCGTPIALISLMDEKRQWFKSNVGLEHMLDSQSDISFCQYIIEIEELLEVPDATQDERFWDNPLVNGHPEVRFYCGVPIKLPMGEIIGYICVLDFKTNYLNDHQRKTMDGLAKLVSQLLMLREINLKRNDIAPLSFVK